MSTTIITCWGKNQNGPFNSTNSTPCGPLNRTNPRVPCCSAGDTCLQDSICYRQGSLTGGTGYYTAECTDENYGYGCANRCGMYRTCILHAALCQRGYFKSSPYFHVFINHIYYKSHPRNYLSLALHIRIKANPVLKSTSTSQRSSTTKRQASGRAVAKILAWAIRRVIHRPMRRSTLLTRRV